MTANLVGKLMSVKVNPAGPTFEYGDPTELFDSGYVNFAHGPYYHTYAVSPDGQRFLIPRPEAATQTHARADHRRRQLAGRRDALTSRRSPFSGQPFAREEQ